VHREGKQNRGKRIEEAPQFTSWLRLLSDKTKCEHFSEGHSVVHYGSCEFTFEGNNKAEFVERHCYSGGGKADSTDDECHHQKELTCGEEM
jgi:hypothetical protein